MDGEWAPVVAALVCGSGATVLLLKWLVHQKIQKKIKRVRARRESELCQAQRAVRDYKEKVNSLTLQVHLYPKHLTAYKSTCQFVTLHRVKQFACSCFFV